MLSNSKFYWGTIRKTIIAFGNMFNDVTIDRKDADGNVLNTIRVPLAYAPKQKFLARIDQLPDPAEERRFGVVLPRMSFEMAGIQYDAQRKLGVLQKNRFVNESTNTLTTQYAPTPYDIFINLYVYSKNTDDALQIVEQILPFFNPDFNLSVKAIPELNLTHDLPIILNSVSYEDNYEDTFETKRQIIWTLTFTLKVNFYGPTSRQGFIRTAKANVYNDVAMTNQTLEYNVTTDPASANPGDEFNFIETFREF